MTPPYPALSQAPDAGDVVVVTSPPLTQAIADPLLSASERARCAAYRHEVDAARHATGRLLARTTAARRLGVGSERVGIRPDTDPATRGRPHLTVDGRDRTDAWVSIAHAGHVVMVAVATQQCGIDVEVVADVAPVVAADTVYGEAEIAALRAMPEPDRTLLAARWWTAKEAVLKATGVGLGIDPPTIDVTTDRVTVADPAHPRTTYPAHLRTMQPARPRTTLPARPRTMWRLYALEAPAGHVATLALPG